MPVEFVCDAHWLLWWAVEECVVLQSWWRELRCQQIS